MPDETPEREWYVPVDPTLVAESIPLREGDRLAFSIIRAKDSAMTDHIEPALSSDQWAEWRRAMNAAGGVADDSIYNDTVGHDAAECAEIIAYNNDALPADDRRKITREWVTFLREQAVDATASDTRGGDAWQFTAMADALESYLPPE